MSKYKYYFKKPKSEIAKDIFKTLAMAGVIVIAVNSPYFIISAWRAYKHWKNILKGNSMTIFIDYLKVATWNLKEKVMTYKSL